MTNSYNGVLENVEQGLSLSRRTTEQVMAMLDKPLPPEDLLRHLFSHQDSIRDWRDAPKDTTNPDAPNIEEAISTGVKVLRPIFNKDNRTGYYTRVAGNFLAGLCDIWVQQDRFSGGQPRQAHIVQYDMLNMEAVMHAADYMINATNENNAGRSKGRKTKAEDFTNGYIRIVNGLVHDEFEHALIEKGIPEAEIPAHLHHVRLSNGDEFRLVVLGLTEEEIETAMGKARASVQVFIERMGFDALPHLKYLPDDIEWHKIKSFGALNNKSVFNAMKYGGAGIKIGAVELGRDLSTSEIEHQLDVSLYRDKETRAAQRHNVLEAAQKAGTKNATVFNQNYGLPDLRKSELGTIAFDKPAAFLHCLKTVIRTNDTYTHYYRRPEVESSDFNYPIKQERENARPANNPEAYLEEFVAIFAKHTGIEPPMFKPLEHVLLEALKAPSVNKPTATEQTHVMLDAASAYFERENNYPAVSKQHLIEKLGENREALCVELARYLDELNPYEALDLTRKRVLDRIGDELHLTPEHREVLLYEPLRFANARDEQGICMSGRVREAVKIFQGNDQDVRQLSYIGLSSFAGVNEISTSLGKSINEEIRRISAVELKKQFGSKALDFAFNVESGRLNLLTHGIQKAELQEVLSRIEMRVEDEINRKPLEVLLHRYHIFTKPSPTMVLAPVLETDREIESMLDIVQKARDEYGRSTPLVFTNVDGNMLAEPLKAAQRTPEVEQALAHGITHFITQRKKEIILEIPGHITDYLRKTGYVKEKGGYQLDLHKPLSQMPNPKHTHERGIRVITAYVELLGTASELADQKKGDLMRLVDAKKNKLYKPGKGYEMDIPVEATPGLNPEIAKVEDVSAAVIKPVLVVDKTKMAEAPVRRTKMAAASHVKRVVQDPVPAYSHQPNDRASWLQKLDQHEFALRQQRQVPQTIMQMIANPNVHVQKDTSGSYRISIMRQYTRYGEENAEAPGRRAAFILSALQQYFGDAAVVSGLNTDKISQNRNFDLFIRPKALPLGQVAAPSELDKFMGDLIVYKARQTLNADVTKHPEAIENALQQSFQQTNFQVRALQLLRRFPTLQIKDEGRAGRRRYTFVLPREEITTGQGARLRRAMKLKEELEQLFKEKAEMEHVPAPTTTRSGSTSTRPHENYEVRVACTPVSEPILELMSDLQFSVLGANASAGDAAGSGTQGHRPSITRWG